MFEPSILLFAPATDARETAQSLNRLRPINLPNTTKYFAAYGKFDGEHSHYGSDVETLYPAALPLLRTLGTWAERSNPSDARFRDGYDLYCLRTILAENDGFDYAVVLRGEDDFDERWPDLQSSVEDQTFRTFAPSGPNSLASIDERNVIFNLRDGRALGLLERAVDLYFSGAAYGMTDYCLRDALATALRSMVIEDQINRPANGSA